MSIYDLPYQIAFRRTFRQFSALVAGLSLALVLACEHAPPTSPPGNERPVITGGDTVRLTFGDSRQFVATVVRGEGEPVAATVAWTSSNAQVLAVDASGLATGVGIGEAYVIAGVAGGRADSVRVTVAAGLPRDDRYTIAAAIDPTWSSASVGLPLSDSVSVKLTDADGRPLPGVEVRWSALPGAGTVSPASSRTDANGLAKACWTLGGTLGLQMALAFIPGTPVGQSFYAHAVPGPAARLTLAPDSVLLGDAGTVLLAAGGWDAFGHPAKLRMTYRSLDTTVVTVSAWGSVLAVRPGVTGIVARDEVSGLAATAPVRVASTSTPGTPLDDSGVPDSLRARYRTIAAQLALIYLRTTAAPENQPLELPAALTDALYAALVRVYLAAELPARDSAVIRFADRGQVHSSMWSLLVYADTAAAVSHAWRQGGGLSGDAQLDSILVRHGLRLSWCCTVDSLDAYRITPAAQLNLWALAPYLLRFEGVAVSFESYPFPLGMSGREIEAYRDLGGWRLDYLVGWGDCPAGCTNRHTWSFLVKDADGVDFVGSSGDAVPADPSQAH